MPMTEADAAAAGVAQCSPAASCADSDTFYQAIGNDYRGQYRSVQATWTMSDHQAHDTLIAKVRLESLEGARGHCIGTNDLSYLEQCQLRAVAWMDACCQPSVLADAHMGKPFVFGALEKCLLGGELLVMGNVIWSCTANGGTLMFNQKHQMVAKVEGASVGYLNSGQLEQSRTQRHLYHTAWSEAQPRPVSHSSQQPGILLVPI